MTSRDFIAPVCKAAINILSSDDDIVVINKPAGLLSVPGRLPENSDSVQLRLQELLGEAHIVHRLDMSTSGLMVVARNKDAQRNLNQQFSKRQVYKEYCAVVFGIVEQDEGDIDQPLICDWPNRPKQKVDSDGKPSLTHYQVIERNLTEHSTRVLLKPVTGRSHQLRVHMAYIGHPISGCEFYAHPAAKAMSNRLLLHASKLQFKHPLSGDDTAINSPANF